VLRSRERDKDLDLLVRDLRVAADRLAGDGGTTAKG
jgi:hypothetical protein